MAGADPTGSFVADDFRADIRGAMVMGLPNDVAMRPTFYFPDDDTFEAASQSGKPWDWTAEPIENDVDRPPVLVPIAVKVAGNDVALADIGTLNPQTAELTILDVDYAKVRGFSEVTMSGATYRYSKLVAINGLFDVDVYTVEVIARDRP